MSLEQDTASYTNAGYSLYNTVGTEWDIAYLVARTEKHDMALIILCYPRPFGNLRDY